MKNFVILFVIFLLCVFQASSQTEAFKFGTDVIWSLQLCKISDDRLKASSLDDPVLMMKALLVYGSGIKQANLFIEAHHENQDTAISSSAEILSNLLAAIEQNNKSLIAFIEESLNEPELALSKKGTWTRKLSEHAAESEELWRLLPVAIAGVTHALVDKESTRDNKLYRLRITKSELKQLGNKLTDAFGEKIKEGPKAGQFPLEASATMLYKFLNQGWKPSDSR